MSTPIRSTAIWHFGWVVVLLLALGACQETPPRPQSALSAAQVAVLRAEGFHHIAGGWEFDGSAEVLFGTNESTLTAQGQVALAKIGHALLGVGIRHAQLYGFTDNTGAADYNLTLSKARAQAVADALINTGMQRADLAVVGRGDNDPVASNATHEGRAANRRVAIVITSP